MKALFPYKKCQGKTRKGKYYHHQPSLSLFPLSLEVQRGKL